ncbi:ATP-binding protein [Streptomyces sp. 21So2-11]|uniref:ATP-binding protein n=1 Tax=Streptomyces sp. 21So2-11 TaxID=3144408 RepID=UPI003219D53C
MPTNPSEIREAFAARLRQELRAPQTHRHQVSDARRAYREAACLLTQFDPTHLRRPGEDRADGGATLELVDDCTALGMKDRCLWSLKPAVREAALRGLAGPQAARIALESNLGHFPDGPGPERTALAFLSGAPQPLETQNVQELGDTLQAVLWLSQVPQMQGLPDTERVQHTLERARLLQPLERLVRGPFQGRTRELDELRSYVGVPPASARTRLKQAGHRLRTTAGGTLEPPLVIHGPGGIGKSTLLAKFILDSLRAHEPDFPFAYVDFERPTLSIHEPVTLIAETARQLGIQYPRYRAELDELANECQQTARTQREEQGRLAELQQLSTTRATLGRGASREFQLLATGHETGLIRRVAELAVRAVGTPAGQEGPPLLIAIDSFEEAQYRGSPVVGRMWAIFVAFQKAYPRLRVVVSGRAPVAHPARAATPRTIELLDLDPEAAAGLLVSCGVKDQEVARELADHVGGHPLSLKLAARAAVLAGNEADTMAELIRSLPARRRYFYRKVDQMLVQGILYDRILNHIANEEVRRLAHPGLVLRTITPEIIKDVLAEPCGLRVDTVDEAVRLFEELSRLDLVEPAGPYAVRHRTDVRAIMLRLSGSDRTAVMRTIEQRAVEYYAARTGLEARAEEIYHRLRLNESPRSVEERWETGVERLLAGAQYDMTPRAAGFLTARLGGEAPEQVMADADQEDWERIAAREAEDLLAQGFAEEASVRIRERLPWTPCSPLHSLLIETLIRTGQPKEARRAASDAVDRAEDAGCAEQRLELLLLSARLAEEDGDLESADRELRVAEGVAAGLGQDLEAMGALLARARLTAGSATGDAEVDTQLALRLRQLPDATLVDQPVLVRAVAAEVYEQDPGALDHALEVVGLPGATDGALDALGRAIDRAVSRQPKLRGALKKIMDSAVGTPLPQTYAVSAGVVAVLREARNRGTLDQLARRLLVLRDESGEIVAGVAEAMRAGTAGTPCDPTERNGPDRPGEP